MVLKVKAPPPSLRHDYFHECLSTKFMIPSVPFPGNSEMSSFKSCLHPEALTLKAQAPVCKDTTQQDLCPAALEMAPNIDSMRISPVSRLMLIMESKESQSSEFRSKIVMLYFH